tara:strand:- start:691 stop:1620 length:930 start_codon:yes stop_codon:yes gene_type:complete
MFIKLLYVNLIFLFFVSIANSSTNIFIYATIDDKIITNLDIQKEGEYLKTLNPNLIQLDDDKVFNLAKDSLINEVIKINEIEKFVNISEDHALVEQYLKNLYSKLNFNNEKNFNDYLLTKKHYSLDEIKQKLKIEILWNELIFSRFSNQVRIDKNAFIKKIKNRKNDTKKEYLLSEIVFEKTKNEKLNEIIKKIKLSIKEIGFSNTANIYSISESSKLGGKIGWVDEKNLSEIIINEISNLNENQYSDVINIGNNYLILKIEKIKSKIIKINEKEELEKMINYENNKQLNQFSRIFFNKSKLNYSINEK